MQIDRLGWKFLIKTYPVFFSATVTGRATTAAPRRRSPRAAPAGPSLPSSAPARGQNEAFGQKEKTFSSVPGLLLSVRLGEIWPFWATLGYFLNNQFLPKQAVSSRGLLEVF